MNDRRITLAHIVNPALVPPSSDLSVAQPITFATMSAAQTFATGHAEVELYSAQFPEDHAAVPPGFIKTPDLTRSVLDLRRFKLERRLPLLRDILDRLSDSTDAEYLIYTNADIALQAHFYVTVGAILRQGFDACVINRRTISTAYREPRDIPLMYAELGQPHPGHDCFVFARTAYSRYRLGSVCIGANWVGKTLLTNLICNATRFLECADLHLTFHRGDERAWRSEDRADYSDHNRAQLREVLQHYETQRALAEHPLLERVVSQMKSAPAP